MIKIHHKTLGLFYQVANNQHLPGATGQVRWNGNTKEFEVCDQNGYWQRIDPSIELDTTLETEETLRWARQKMQDERKLKELADKNPAVKVAYENFKQAEEQLQIITILSSTP